MAAKDVFHEAVKQALEKDGWTITHDPLTLHAGGIDVQIDLGADSLLAATKASAQIAVEVKSFVSPSAISDFHMALGQFLNYQQVLEEQDPLRALFLAVPLDTYDTFFQLPFVRRATQRHSLKLLVYEPHMEVIVRWDDPQHTVS